MPLPDLFLQELKARTDMAELVASYVNLRRSGRNLVGLCPFHHEKTPSFNVYPENGSFYCFGCGVGGDVITFVRKIENLDYMEAVRFLANRAGMQVPEEQVDDTMARLRARVLEINRETARFFHRVLLSPEGRPGLDYLTRRGLSMKTIRHFGLGFSPPGRFSLTDHLKKMGYTDQELIQANVAFQSRSGRTMDRFASRVMFPIIDLRGNVVAFGGRILTDEKPKYINTSDTPVYHKSSGLFAMNFAKNNGGEQLILAEGYMDVISLHQAGFTNAMASLGTSLTMEQARLMARYAKEVVICYDSDAAGQKAASRAIPMLRDAGLLVKVLTVPGNKDPDEYIRSHGEEGHAYFKRLLDSCGNDVEYRLARLRDSCNMNTSEGRVAYLTGAAQLLATLDNRIEQEVYAGKLAEETGVDKSAILMQVKKQNRQRQRQQAQRQFRETQQQLSAVRDTVNPEKSRHLRAVNAEEALIAYLFKHPDGAAWVKSRIPPEKFSTAFTRRVYEAVLGKITDNTPLSLTLFTETLTGEEISAVARILAKYASVSVEHQDAEEYIQVILQESGKLSEEQLRSASGEDLMQQLQALREMKK